MVDVITVIKVNPYKKSYSTMHPRKYAYYCGMAPVMLTRILQDYFTGTGAMIMSKWITRRSISYILFTGKIIYEYF